MQLFFAETVFDGGSTLNKECAQKQGLLICAPYDLRSITEAAT